MASIICGSCKGRHGSVAEVRLCYKAPAGSVAVMEAKPVRFNPADLEDGFYKIDKSREIRLVEPGVYKVIVAKNGSGRKYAKVLDMETGVWEYAKGAISALRPENKITQDGMLEVAKSFGLNPNSELYGRCWMCKLPLTDDLSISRGIGPVCWEK